MDRSYENWMHLALKEAEAAAEQGEVPVGAVLVRNGELLAKAHNLCEKRKSALAHAEILVIEEASAKLGTWRLNDCTLFVTLEPCPMCTGALINARIQRIVYAAKDPRAGACGSLLSIPSYPLESTPELVSGILAEQSLALLRSFFLKKRKPR